MNKKFLISFIMVCAYALVLGHGMVAHYHHDDVSEIAHHDEDSEKSHSLFSFGQLDESYIQSSDQVNLNTNFVFLSIVNTIFNLKLIGDTDKQESSIAEDYPPSDNPYSKSHSLRGPPIIS
jgi:Ca2+/H+ antiporter